MNTLGQLPSHKIEWTDELVQRFWTYYADNTEAYFTEKLGPAIVRKTRHLFPVNAICVDYGCGSGGLTAALLSAGYNVAALDFSPNAVANVNSRFAGRDGFLGARIVTDTATPFPPADIVFSVETIEHVTDKHIDDYFATIRDLLKPSGSAIFTTPNNEDIEAASVFCPESGAVFHPMQHVRSFDEERIANLLRAHGFAAVATFVTDFALSLNERPKAWLADKGKRLLRMGTRPPHLVAIARKRA